MNLSKTRFEQLFQKNQLTLSFIGMSNIGKTYWSEKFSGIGFKHFNCDDLIEAKLSPVLKKLGYSGVADVSRWMGQPYDEGFFANQQKYLALEKEIMENILTQIKNKEKQNTVIDTTGSVIHTNENICFNLKQYSLIVYIEADKNMEREMFKQYCKKPKPVIFGNVFNIKGKETNKQALKRCYRKLLDLRGALYTKYADVIIPRGAIPNNINTRRFISLIEQSL